MALPDSLEKLLDEGIIDDVHGRLLSGKEASVFMVERKDEIIAAKVYKSRDNRSFRSTADYTEGRNQLRNTRDRRAVQRRSSYGQKLMEENWRDMEFRALSDAFHAGVRVPEPILLYEDVLLMELLVDETGEPAPRLADFELLPEVAELLHREVFGQVRLLLASGRVHGDLSAFNILITYKGATLIDFPQVIDAAGNRQAAEILQRDLKNVTEHLARFHPPLMALKDCGEALWRHYQRGTLDSATEPEPGRAGQRSSRGRRHKGRPDGRQNRDRDRDGGNAAQHSHRPPRDGKSTERRRDERGESVGNRPRGPASNRQDAQRRQERGPKTDFARLQAATEPHAPPEAPRRGERRDDGNGSDNARRSPGRGRSQGNRDDKGRWDSNRNSGPRDPRGGGGGGKGGPRGRRRPSSRTPG